MRIIPLILLFGSLHAGDLEAQVLGNRNGVRLFNEPSIAFLQSFPGYFTGGNQSGDAIFQVYPEKVLKHASGGLELTAVVLPLFVQNYGQPGFVELPDFAVRPATQAAGAPAGCLVPDYAAAPFGSVSTAALQLPSGGAWSIEVALTTTAGQMGIAVLNGAAVLSIEATPGESIVSENSVRLLVSRAGTSRDPLGCGFGAAGVHSPSGAVERLPVNVELMSEMAFREPLVFAVQSVAGGPVDEGFGALDPQIRGGGTRIGWRLEAYQGIGQIFLPLFSFSGASQLFPFDGQAVLLDIDPFIDMLLVFQQAGAIASNGAPAPETDGTWASFLFPMPSDPLLGGVQMNVAGFLYDLGSGRAVGATNTVTQTLRF